MTLPQLPPEQQSKSKPVLYLALTVTGAIALLGVLAAVPGIPWWVLTGLAGVAAVGNAIGGVLTGQKTVPWQDVVAKITPTGNTVAGPAADQRTGTSVVVQSASRVIPNRAAGDPVDGPPGGMTPPV